MSEFRKISRGLEEVYSGASSSKQVASLFEQGGPTLFAGSKDAFRRGGLNLSNLSTAYGALVDPARSNKAEIAGVVAKGFASSESVASQAGVGAEQFSGNRAELVAQAYRRSAPSVNVSI